MLYTFIRWLTRIALKAYFRKVIVTGTENIPAHGPVIIVANHPSAFMDPMVICTITNRSLHFVTAGEYMGRGLKSWICRKQLNMIPVYRPSAARAGETVSNDGMFAQCYELLNREGTVLVFPEGNSVTERRVRKLKTGAARMALGARHASPDKTEVSIVPVGLNYANPHRFQSEVFVKIGRPITTAGFNADLEGVAALTAEIESRLKEASLHVEHEELDSVVKKVELIMKSEASVTGKQLATVDSAPAEGRRFLLHQQLIDVIQKIHACRPEAIQQLEKRLDAYLAKIRQMGISDKSVAALSPLTTAGERIRLALGRPLFIAGFLINAIPYYLTVLLFRMLNLFPRTGTTQSKQKINPAFRGSIGISIGMIVFIHWYLGWATVFALMTGLWWVAIVALAGFYMTGQFTLKYLGWTLRADQKSKIRRILGRGTDLYAELIVERRGILESIITMTQESQTKTAL